jgi:hypothetical protein
MSDIQQQLEACQKERNDLLYQRVEMQEHLLAEIAWYAQQEQEYRAGGDEILATMYKGMKEAVEGVWKRFYEVRKPESEGSNG